MPKTPLFLVIFLFMYISIQCMEKQEITKYSQQELDNQLIEAIENPNSTLNNIAEILKKGANPDAQDKYSQPAIQILAHDAFIKHRDNKFKLLLDAGAYPYARTRYGTIFHIMSNHLTLCPMLIEAAQKYDIYTKSILACGRTAFICNAICKIRKKTHTPKQIIFLILNFLDMNITFSQNNIQYDSLKKILHMKLNSPSYSQKHNKTPREHSDFEIEIAKSMTRPSEEYIKKLEHIKELLDPEKYPNLN